MRRSNKPTWHHAIPPIYIAAGMITEGGFIAGLCFFVAGMWTSIILAHHCGWRLVAQEARD